MVNGVHSASFVANVLENVLEMPREDVARVSLSRAHLAEEEPRPEGEQMGALGETADDGGCDERKRKVEDKLDGMGFASSKTVGVEIRVMFVVEVLEHKLYVEQAMRPVEQRVFEDIEESELEEELGDGRKAFDGAGEASGGQQRVADQTHWKDNHEVSNQAPAEDFPHRLLVRRHSSKDFVFAGRGRTLR